MGREVVFAAEVAWKGAVVHIIELGWMAVHIVHWCKLGVW